MRSGDFHVWAIDNVDQGISILTGVPAGELLADNTFSKDTVNYLVQQRLTAFAQYLKNFPERTATS